VAKVIWYLSCKEQGSRCYGVSVEFSEGVEHVEPLHVDDGRVDAELSHLQSLAHILDKVGGLLAVALLLVRGDRRPPRGGRGQLFL